MEILYSAIEEKQAELEESLTTLHQRQQQIRDEFKCDEDPETFTQNDHACIQLQELQEHEKLIQDEFEILSLISKTNGEFEDIRLAARDAHTCMLDENNFGTCIDGEEYKMSQHADKSDHKHQGLIIEYKRLKKAPPADKSQEELLLIFMDMERKISKEKVKRDLFTIMAEHLLYELNRSRQENSFSIENDSIAI